MHTRLPSQVTRQHFCMQSHGIRHVQKKQNKTKNKPNAPPADGVVEAVIDLKQRTSYRLSDYCLSDWEGDCDPPAVACQRRYWKSPSICSRYRDCEGQVATFRLMWRSLRFLSLWRTRVLGMMGKKKWAESVGDYKKVGIIVLSSGTEYDHIRICTGTHGMNKTRTVVT